MRANDPTVVCDTRSPGSRFRCASRGRFWSFCLGAQILAMQLGAGVAPHPQSLTRSCYYPIRPTACAAPGPIKSISGTAKALSCHTAPNCSPTRRFSRASTTVRPRFRVPVSSRRDDCDDALLDCALRDGFPRRAAASSSLRGGAVRRGGTRLARGFHQGLACAYAGRDGRASARSIQPSLNVRTLHSSPRNSNPVRCSIHRARNSPGNSNLVRSIHPARNSTIQWR